MSGGLIRQELGGRFNQQVLIDSDESDELAAVLVDPTCVDCGVRSVSRGA